MMTERLIKLLIENDEIELEKIYMKKDWIKDVDINKVYEGIINLNNPSISNLIGYFYDCGIIFEKNKEKAIKYYLETANKGSMIALQNVGVSYYIGSGVELNYEKAAKYFKLSVKKGSTKALINIAKLYGNGCGVSQDYEKSEQYLMFAIQKCPDFYIHIIYNELGNLYRYHKKDFKKAAYYYELATKTGPREYHLNLVSFYKNNMDIEINNERVLYHYIMGIQKNEYQDYEKLLSDFFRSLSYNDIFELFRIKFDEISSLEEENKKLREENDDLKYRPGGPGYHKAKEEFEDLASKFE